MLNSHTAFFLSISLLAGVKMKFMYVNISRFSLFLWFIFQTAIIKELEGRVQQLTGEVDRTLSQRSLLEKEKVDLQSTVEKLTCDLERAHER